MLSRHVLSCALQHYVSEADRAVQWHYIDMLWNDTVPNHSFITTNHQAVFIYNRTKIMGWFPVLPLKRVLSHVKHSVIEQPY